MKSRIRHLTCGHHGARVVDYGDDFRWVLRCSECGQIEHWTGQEWRAHLRSIPCRPSSRLLIQESTDSRRLVGLN